MQVQGRKMFENVLDTFEKAGIDIKDPLELILVLRKLNPLRFEQLFHPSTYEDSDAEIAPFYPTVLAKQTIEIREEIIGRIAENGYSDSLKGKKIIVASGDCHTYGLVLIEGVFKALGAEVINGGVDTDAIDLLDLADEEGTNIVAISCHNGQSLDYSKQLAKIAGKRDKDYLMFMGGVLNAILEGHAVPTNVEKAINELGVYAQNDLLETVKTIIKNS
jgi:methylmalonyl-CoA mutase cobalamin-binding subunit